MDWWVRLVEFVEKWGSAAGVGRRRVRFCMTVELNRILSSLYMRVGREMVLLFLMIVSFGLSVHLESCSSKLDSWFGRAQS